MKGPSLLARVLPLRTSGVTMWRDKKEFKKIREVMVGQDVNGTLLFTFSGISALKLRQTQGLATSPSNPKDLQREKLCVTSWPCLCGTMDLAWRGAWMSPKWMHDDTTYILSLKHSWRSLDNISWNQTASTFINLANQICSTYRASFKLSFLRMSFNAFKRRSRVIPRIVLTKNLGGESGNQTSPSAQFTK